MAAKSYGLACCSEQASAVDELDEVVVPFLETVVLVVGSRLQPTVW